MKSGPNGPADKHIKEIKRKTRRQFSAEKNIGIVLVGQRGEISIFELSHREGFEESLYYNWSKDFRKPGGSAWLAIQPAKQRPAK